MGCGSPTLTEAQLAAARAQNQPFKFDKAPFSLNASISLPIFNGFAREQNVEAGARESRQRDRTTFALARCRSRRMSRRRISTS